MKEKNKDNMQTQKPDVAPILPNLPGTNPTNQEYTMSYGNLLLSQSAQISTKVKNREITRVTQQNKDTLQNEEFNVISYSNPNGQISFDYYQNINPNNVAKILGLKGDTNRVFIYLYGVMLAKINGNAQVKKAKDENDIIKTFNLNLDEMAHVFGKTDQKAFNRNIKGVIEQLEDLKLIVYPDYNGVIDYTAEPARLPILGDIVPFRGGYRLTLGSTLSYMIAKNTGGIFPLSYLYFRLSNNNPVAVRLMYKLNTHYTMRNNQVKRTNNIISVESLLKDIDETILPSYETVMKGNGNVTQRIIDPFASALDKIADDSNGEFTWNFCKAGHEPLTDKELEKIDYKDFIRLYIEFDFNNLPVLSDEEIEDRIEISKKTKEIKARAKAKKAGELEAIKEHKENKE